uniref:RWP-RK domain-containing protein n=1 Tax=Leersia perrieri TaxID=77586 RepID=A0A0D9XXY7_9ORYZ
MADGGGGGVVNHPIPLMDDDFDDILRLLDSPVDLGLGYHDAAAAPAPVMIVEHEGGGGQLPTAAAVCSSSGDDDFLVGSIDNVVVDGGGGGASTSSVVTTSAALEPAPAPPQEDALGCSGCHVLREVVHSNGLEMTKLCVHGDGGIGVFYHAILDVYRVNAEVPAPALVHHSIVEGRGNEWVNQYLTDYILRRASGGFAVMHDLVSSFHKTLCTTMERSSHVNDAHKRASAAAAAAAKNNGNGDDRQPVVHTDVVQQPGLPKLPVIKRNSLSNSLPRREKTRKLQLGDIAPYFELPIAKAASKLDVCATALKGICRKHGVSRWPYRKVRSIDRQIATLRRSDNGDATREEIERLSALRKRVVEGFE